jgi:hypothetical protein
MDLARVGGGGKGEEGYSYSQREGEITQDALYSTRSPPPRYTLYKYIPLYLFTQGRGREGETVRRIDGRQFKKGVV